MAGAKEAVRRSLPRDLAAEVGADVGEGNKISRRTRRARSGDDDGLAIGSDVIHGTPLLEAFDGGDKKPPLSPLHWIEVADEDAGNLDKGDGYYS